MFLLADVFTAKFCLHNRHNFQIPNVLRSIENHKTREQNHFLIIFRQHHACYNHDELIYTYNILAKKINILAEMSSSGDGK